MVFLHSFVLNKLKDKVTSKGCNTYKEKFRIYPAVKLDKKKYCIYKMKELKMAEKKK